MPTYLVTVGAHQAYIRHPRARRDYPIHLLELINRPPIYAEITI